MKNLLFEEITKKMIGASFKVHTQLGCGYPEVIYQRALSIEMKDVGLNFERESELPIYYKHPTISIGKRRVDFVVEKKVLVELKAKRILENIDHAKILSYLKVYKIEIGLLINFGQNRLEFKRFILTDQKII